MRVEPTLQDLQQFSDSLGYVFSYAQMDNGSFSVYVGDKRLNFGKRKLLVKKVTDYVKSTLFFDKLLQSIFPRTDRGEQLDYIYAILNCCADYVNKNTYLLKLYNNADELSDELIANAYAVLRRKGFSNRKNFPLKIRKNIYGSEN